MSGVAIAVAVIAVLLCLVGLAGIIIPVLPGSITIGGALLIWAIWGESGWGWWAFGIGAVFLAAGAVSGMVLTKRGLDRREIPTWPILVGLACGVVGAFVLPALGLVIGFVVGLLVAEYARVKEFSKALETSWVAIKSVGIGMLIELGCAMVATSLLTLSIVTAAVL